MHGVISCLTETPRLADADPDPDPDTDPISQGQGPAALSVETDSRGAFIRRRSTPAPHAPGNPVQYSSVGPIQGSTFGLQMR